MLAWMEWYTTKPQFDDVWRSTFVHPCLYIVYSFWLSQLYCLCMFVVIKHEDLLKVYQELSRDLIVSAYLIQKWRHIIMPSDSCQNMTPTCNWFCVMMLKRVFMSDCLKKSVFSGKIPVLKNVRSAVTFRKIWHFFIAANLGGEKEKFQALPEVTKRALRRFARGPKRALPGLLMDKKYGDIPSWYGIFFWISQVILLMAVFGLPKRKANNPFPTSVFQVQAVSFKSTKVCDQVTRYTPRKT